MMLRRGGRVRVFALAITALVLAILALGLSGCATTNLRSQVSPEFEGGPYKYLLVWFELDDELLMQSAEDYLVDELKAIGVDAVAEYKLFFGGREYTLEDRKRKLSERGVDAVLTISLTDAGATRRHIPPTRYTVSRMNPYTGRVHHSTHWTGGTVDVNAWADFKATLLDRRSEQIVWRALAETSGDPSVGRVAFLQSLSRQIAGNLKKDGIVATR